MVENAVRNTPKQPVENQEQSDSAKEVGNSLSMTFEDARAGNKADACSALFDLVLKNEAADGNVDLRRAFNLETAALEDNSPIKKYVHADRAGRSDVLNAIVSDCMSTDPKQKERGVELLQKVMYLEALANLSATQGKTDSASSAHRSHALRVLTGQELSGEKIKDKASTLLGNLAENGDKKIQAEIASARKDVQKERGAVINAAVKKGDQLEKGDLSAAAKMLVLHLQQVGEGNRALSTVGESSYEVLEAAAALKKAVEKPVTLEDAKPTGPRQGRTPDGILILPGDNGDAYAQYNVKAGSVFNAEGREIGKFRDDGTVLLSGMSAFKIAPNDGCAFHGKGSDGQRLDLISNADQKKFHGFVASADGKEVFTVTGGNMYDAKGKMLGKFGEGGEIETTQPGSFSSEALSKFRPGARVIGEENGKSRSFIAGSTATDGHVQIKDQETGAYVRHEVKMGMLIDSRTGEQKGWIVPPAESADGKLTGGFIVTAENGEMKSTAFTDKQDMIFSLRLTGVGGHEAAPMQGITTGKDEIFNVGEAKRLQVETKEFFADAKRSIEASEKGWGWYSPRTFFNVSQKEQMALKITASENNIEEMNKLLTGDRSAVAYVDSFKRTAAIAKEALHPKAENSESAEKPPVNEVPNLDTAELMATVNGKLAIGSQKFTIKNGDLYEMGKETQAPVGKLLPGYVAKFAQGDRVVDLNNEIRVAMSFTSQANAKTAELLGMGPGYMSGGLGYQQGGLIDVKSLSATAWRFEEQARKGNQDYFANKPYVTGEIGNWMMGDREAMLTSYAQQLAARAIRVERATKDLMKDAFDPSKDDPNMFDVARRDMALLVHITGSQCSDHAKMALQGRQVQAQVSDSAAMAAMTIATAGIGAGFAAAAKGGQLAAVGITSTRVAFALEMGSGMAAGAAIRTAVNATDSSDWRTNAASGALEGLALAAQGRLLAKIAEAKAAANALKQTQEVTRQTFLQASMSTARQLAPEALKEAGVSTMFAAMSMTAHDIRTGKTPGSSMDLQTLAVASMTNLLGRYASFRAGDLMSSKFVQGAVSEAGKVSLASTLVRTAADASVAGATARVPLSVFEQRQAPFGEVSLARTALDALESGAMAASTGMVMSGLMKAGDYGTRYLASRYAQTKAEFASPRVPEERTVEISQERMRSLVKRQAPATGEQTPAAQEQAPIAPRKLESLWKGLSNAEEAANKPRQRWVPENRPVETEPELTQEQRRTNELDFQRRYEAGEYAPAKAPVDNKPVSDPVEISQRAINNYLKDIKQRQAEGRTGENDDRPMEVIKPQVYFDDFIGPRQLDTISVPAKKAINDALAIVAKTGAGAANDIANQTVSITPKPFGHVREINSQMQLAKTAGGEIDPANNFVKTGSHRVEGIIDHVRNASKDLPEVDYFSTMQEIAGRRGLNRWMDQNPQRRAINHEVAKDHQKRLEAAQEDPSKDLFLRRSLRVMGELDVAATATAKTLEGEIARLEKAGQSADNYKQALTKLQAFQKNLEQAKQDTSHNAIARAYFAEVEAYKKQAFED